MYERTNGHTLLRNKEAIASYILYFQGCNIANSTDRYYARSPLTIYLHNGAKYGKKRLAMRPDWLALSPDLLAGSEA